MPDCKNLKTCAFFKTYKNDVKLRVALNGFVSMYCQGEKQDVCIRKKISTALGGADMVPVNMMPNGYPISGTDKDDWADEVFRLIKRNS